ncbi:MAG: AMP-binding protein [Bacteroidota bacterium]
MQEHPWSQHYPPSVPHTINPDRYESLVALVEESLERYKQLPMCENMGTSLTYGEIDTLSQAFAAYLQTYTSLRQGDHIAIQLPNLLQYPVAMLGILRAGMVVVNVNPLYTPYEMEYQLKDAAVKAIVTLANFAHNLASILHKTFIETIIITEVGDLLSRLKGHLTNFAVKHIKRLVPSYHLPKAIMFNKALQAGRQEKFKRIRPRGEQTAFLQYTGGTTGIAKGAVLTHKNVIANIEQISSFVRIKLKEGEEVMMTPLPLYHIFSLTVNLLAMIKLGAKNVLITNPRDLKAFIKELSRHRFTCITGVNTLFNSLSAQQQFASLDFSSLKIASAGGIALQDIVAKQWEAVTDVPLIEGYGLTEASPSIACNMPDGTHRMGTVGIPLPSTLVKIVDDAGQDVAEGKPGNLLVKGPQVMKEYWQKPAETEKVLLNGWLQTGDVAVMSKDGYIKIVDRKKEMINVSGFNVYPNEIESVITTHPKVLEAGAIGVLEVCAKEAIKLFVVKKDPSLMAKEVIAYCKDRLTNYKVPKYVEFRDSLPKSNVGKVLRRVLQEEEMQRLDTVSS